MPPGPNQLRARVYHLRESVTITADETRQVSLKIGAGTLRGTVLKDLQPVKGEASVSRPSSGGFFGGGFMMGRGNTEVEIDENGMFEIKDLAPGKWQVAIDVDDARPGNFEVEIPNDGVVEKTFNMPSGDLIGKVVDAQDQPIAGARISIVATAGSSQGGTGGFGGFGGFDGGGGGGGRGGFGGFGGGGRRGGVQSGADGTFRIEDQDPGTMIVMAEKEGIGYSEQIEGQVPDQGDSAEVTLKIGASETGTLVSTALYLETGGPIPNAYCNLFTSKGRVSHRERRGENGVVTITKLPVGTYTVEVGAMNFTSAEQTVQVTAAQPAEVTHVLSSAGSFRWSILDANGTPVANANCQLTPQDPNSIESPRTGKTGESGAWFVRGVIPGSYLATCTSIEGKMVTAQVTITAASPASEVSVLQ